MKSAALIISILILLTACGERVAEAARIVSPDGLVIAVYEKYYFGGAAGGTGHCISIIRNEGDERNCELLGSRVCVTLIEWEDRTLIVRFRDGEFTRETSMVSISKPSGGANQYYFQLVADEADKGCLSEWD